jgi:ribosomal-protein-alanine N-acetyltransferase
MTRELVAEKLGARIAHQREHGFSVWALDLRESGTLIGAVGLQQLEGTDEIESAWLVARLHWGKGLATEAARASLTLGFERFQLPRILAATLPENIASIRVMEKLGMSRVENITRRGLEHVCYVAMPSETL